MGFKSSGDTAPKWLNKSLGFKKTYNFVLWFILAGALLGFSLARLEYLDRKTVESKLIPGDTYWYRGGHYRVGLVLHLACILPAGILTPFQFVPQIRYKAILFHRINGYTIITLVMLGTAGALMLARRAFGGDIATQILVVVLSFAVVGAIVMAYVNIKRLQIDQHRKWMIRAMVWMSIIITGRLIMLICAYTISALGGYATVWRCDEVQFALKNAAQFASQYPSCVGAPPETHVAVQATMSDAVTTGAAFRACFGAAMWISLALHVFGTECYFALTKDESERLRRVSYKMQLERGFRHPGSGGLTSDRLGDSSWEMPAEEGKSRPKPVERRNSATSDSHPVERHE